MNVITSYSIHYTKLYEEHRWLHNITGEVPKNDNFRIPLSKAEVLKEGKDITIISMSYMSIEAVITSYSIHYTKLYDKKSK